MNAAALDTTRFYRLPWTLPDNGITWLEPTEACNLACDGCYRRASKRHKPWAEVMGELDLIQRVRRSDCISIAGGDPLLYPEIVDLVAEIKRRGLKPIVNTNGVALTDAILRDLARAGVYGLTFHVDSRQKRGGEWDGRDEIGLNELRLRYARQVHAAGNIACAFNSTVYEENLHLVPEMVAWAQRHVDLVQSMVFICFRHVVPGLGLDWFAGNDKVDWDRIWYHSEQDRQVVIDAPAVVAKLREREPGFTPAAFLNGTEDPSACKWLLTERVATPDRVYGYLGPRFVEALMTGYHMLKGRYLAYVSPSAARRGRTAMALGAAVKDQDSRRALRSYAGALLKSPRAWRHRPRLQTIMIIQPVDFMTDGRQSMCDGCPDLTVHEGRLVWSCRLEEVKQFGSFLRTVPKGESAATAPPGALRARESAE